MEQLVLYEGRPADCTGRLEKEVRTYDFLDKLGIHYWRTDHAWMKADTMEDCHVIDACLNAAVCKNLFLCNRQKTNFYLLMMPGNKPFKTKELSHQLGIARLSFASPEDMEQYLDCTPGSSSIMGLMNDPENHVQLLLDKDVKAGEFIGCHPCITGDTKVYAKWEKNAPVLPDTYELNVSGAFVYVDGVDVTASAGDTTLPLEKDASVRLVADPDRMPSGMVFDRWTILNGALNADDAEKFETGRTLEEFAFTMPAEPLSIEATPRMQEEEGSDTVSVIAGVTLGTAATALVAWQAYDLGMSLYQEHWLPADFVMPKTRAELALLLWNTAGRPAPAAQPAFTDIPDPDTAQAAQWAVETGLMTPKSADRFKPEKSVTRWKAVRSWKRVTNQNT